MKLLKLILLTFLGSILVTPYTSAKEVSRYLMDGNVIDSGLNEYHGIITGTVTSTANRFGEAGKALKFTNGYATVSGYKNYNFYSKLSVSLWMRRDTSGTYMGVIGNGYTTRTFEIRMGREDNSSFMFARSNWTTGATSTSTRNVIQVGTWHHVALVQDRGNSKLYIDGVLVSEANVNPGALIVRNENVIIGANSTTLSERFNGAIDDIRIFDHALTPDDVTALFNDTYQTPHSVELSKVSGQADVPATGGSILYDVLLNNALTNSSSEFLAWAVLTLPNGDSYSERAPELITIMNGETLIQSNQSIDIPAWFAPGSYELTWYLADPEKVDGLINVGKINFIKL